MYVSGLKAIEVVNERMEEEVEVVRMREEDVELLSTKWIEGEHNREKRGKGAVYKTEADEKVMTTGT